MKIRCLFVLLSICCTAIAQQQTFVREYSYQASDLDSKVSSRAIATDHLRTILLNEIGVYVERESLLKTNEIKGEVTQDYIETITTISAGVANFEILEEKWDGKIFWLKAAITVDKTQLTQSLEKLIKDRHRTKEFEILKEQLGSLKAELTELREKLQESDSSYNIKELANTYSDKIEILTTNELVSRGLSKFAVENYSGAISDLTEAIMSNPTNSYAYFCRGMTKVALLDNSGAIADYTKAIEIDPRNSKYYTFRGIAKVTTTTKSDEFLNIKSAIEDFTQAILLDGQNYEAYLMRGAARAVFKEYDKAISDYTSAISIDHKNIEAYNARGLAKVRLKDFKSAITDFTIVIQLDPNNSEALIRRGASKITLGDHRSAIGDLIKALEIEPNNSLALLNLGIAKISLGQRTEGCKDLNLSLQLGNNQAYELLRKHCN